MIRSLMSYIDDLSSVNYQSWAGFLPFGLVREWGWRKLSQLLILFSKGWTPASRPIEVFRNSFAEMSLIGVPSFFAYKWQKPRSEKSKATSMYASLAILPAQVVHTPSTKPEALVGANLISSIQTWPERKSIRFFYQYISRFLFESVISPHYIR